jgi:hypothetical protein
MYSSCPRIICATLTIAITTGISACNRDRASRAVDSSAARPVTEIAHPPAAVNTGWNEVEAGPVLLLSLPEAVNQAHVVLPFTVDSTSTRADAERADSIRGSEFELFDRSGKIGLVTLQSVANASPVEGCSSWPVSAFVEPPSRAWRIGFSYRTAKGLMLDSLESASTADSVAVTTELARLSSMVTATGDPAFQGLPFTVREAYRLKLADTAVLIGDVVRTINEEANPREEHLLLIAEKNPSSSQYHTAFYSRAAGSEEQVRTTEILGAVQFVNGNRAAIIVSFEYEDGGRVALVERVSNGEWKLVWRSAYTGC